MGTVRAREGKDLGETALIRREACSADLTQQLSGFTIVAIQVRLGGLAGRAGAIFRNIAF